MIINQSAQYIIDKWYSHIIIHNTNLIHITCNLPLNINYDNYGMSYYYYDLTSKNVGITFNICNKYLNTIISSQDWWFNHIKFAFNGISVINISSINHDIYTFNCNSIYNFYNKLCLSDFYY